MVPETATPQANSVVSTEPMITGFSGSDTSITWRPELPSATYATAPETATPLAISGVSTEPILIGQVQVVNVDNPEQARTDLLANREEILALANSLHPKMVARGGGALDIEVFQHHAPEDGREMVVLHLLVRR